MTGFLRIFSFSCVFLRNFLEERGFGGGRRNSYVRRPGTVGLVQTGFLRGFLNNSRRTGIVIPVKKVPQERKTQES